MKKIILTLTVIGFVFAFGSAYADAGRAMINRGADSIINTLDPSAVPGYVDLETGVVTRAPEAVIARGSAAGGAGREIDTIMNTLDPSTVPGYVDLETGVVTKSPEAVIARGSAAGGISMDHDTILNTLDPSKVPGYVDLETGVVAR